MYCSTLAQSTPAGRKADLSGNSGHAALCVAAEPIAGRQVLGSRHDQTADGRTQISASLAKLMCFSCLTYKQGLHGSQGAAVRSLAGGDACSGLDPQGDLMWGQRQLTSASLAGYQNMRPDHEHAARLQCITAGGF